MKNKIFWNETFKGKCHGGYFTRCDLKKHIKQFEEKGYKVVGIKCSEDSDWNLEFICEEPKDRRKNEKSNTIYKKKKRRK